MDNLLAQYRTVAIEDGGPYPGDRRHPLVLAGYHQLLLRRAGGGVVDKIPYLPAQRPAAVASARSTVDGYGRQGFSWVAPAEPPTV